MTKRFLISVSLLLGAFFCSQVLPLWKPIREKDRSTHTADALPEAPPKKSSLQSQKNTVEPKLDLFDEWCQIDYTDLSKDKIFIDFNRWLDEIDSLGCSLGDDCAEHDPRRVRELLTIGETLAQERAKVMQKIIRGDPETALRLALPADRLQSLPASVRNHMESWRSDIADIKSMHVCFDPKHPGGYVNRTATLSDGTKVRAWVFGKRKNLPSIRGLSVWGVSIGGDFAISDQPIRDLASPGEKVILLGDRRISYATIEERSLFEEEVRAAEKKAFLRQIPVRYPRLAASSGLTDYYDRKYDLIINPSTWLEAKTAAEENNGTLVIIGTATENRFIRSLFTKDQERYPGYDESNNSVDLVWIGATDFEDENHTFFEIEKNSSRLIELNATEGDWKWLDGTDVGNPRIEVTVPPQEERWQYFWKEENEPASPTKDYAAMEWSDANGSWIDVNGSFRLPFVIEYQLENEPKTITTPIDGHRKVLVVPARFYDEGYQYKGSGGPLVDEFGNLILEELQKDSYEPVSQANLSRAMEEVKDFFYRNSDGTFHLDAVITPTMTIPFDKYYPDEGGGSPNLFDSSGNYIGLGYVEYDSETEVELAYYAVEIAGLEDEAWDWDGPAFVGVVSVEGFDPNEGTAFESPPVISFWGGGNDPFDNNRVRQRFEPAKGEAITDGEGKLLGIRIIDSGAYYFDAPTVLINGKESSFYDYNLTATIDTTCVSWVGITTNDMFGAAGVGFIGAPGSHVDATGGSVSATTIAHELGHNFGLLHANRLVTRSERPNSDEAELIDYGNPYSVMGEAQISNNAGDLTITEKVVTKFVGNFGLTYGNAQGFDVAHVLTESEWEDSPFRKGAEDGLPENSFRIYRHDYEDGPLSLRLKTFDLFIPEEVLENSLRLFRTTATVSNDNKGKGYTSGGQVLVDGGSGSGMMVDYQVDGQGGVDPASVVVTDNGDGYLHGDIVRIPGGTTLAEVEIGQPNYPKFPLSFLGTGEGAAGTLELLETVEGGPNAELSIVETGIGFSSAPKVLVLHENGSVLLSLDPAWIREANGAQNGSVSSWAIAELRDYGAGSNRGIRGLHLKASDYSPKGLDYEDENLNAFWISYRRSASEFGISVLQGSTGNPENFLLDMSLSTPGDFSDAFLLLGHTFSDYDSDVHVTPYRKGGTYPMEYLEVIVNQGTVQGGSSAAPDFFVEVSNKTPAVGEYVQISAQVADNNASGYAFAWFTDEVMESAPEFLNKPSILKSFSRAGQFVIRVMVSDLKGGISSRNVVLQVGDYEKTPHSSLSGTVRASQGYVEGARVAVAPAEIIEHTVSVDGAFGASQIPSGINDPASFLIDGVSAPDLVLRRGEIHRFYFDANTEGFPMTFLEHPEHEIPRVRLNMLVTPIVDHIGRGYANPPLVYVDEVSSFANYFSNDKGAAKIGAINDFYLGDLEDSSSEPLLITRPFAKALLAETLLESVLIRPAELDIDGNYVRFGGKGHDRDNPPNVFVFRSSLWENYRDDENASAKAYVDGVGTIVPVTSIPDAGRRDILYQSIWETRSAADPIPELVVWGSGGNEARPYLHRPYEDELSDTNESHAVVSEYVDTQKPTIPYRQIEIFDQGINFEPDSTMAVLQYPLDPMAYWTFDRHESLFDDSSGARFQPSPGWNALQRGSTDLFPNDGKLTGYWSFDEESGTSVASINGSDINLPFDLSQNNRSQWGVKGRAAQFDGATDYATDNLVIGSVADSGSLSMWLRTEEDFTFSIGSEDLNYVHASGECAFSDAPAITRSSSYEWMHLAIVGEDNQTVFYLDGQRAATTEPKILGEVSTADFTGLLDEAHIFSSSLSEAQVKILGGKIFLDLSGNKVHAAPVGPDFPMSHPDTDSGLSSDRPSVSTHARPKGSSSPSFGFKLGDSYLGEDHGRSLVFDDNDSYLDLSPHAFYFAAEDQGSISFWIKTTGRDEDGDPTDQNVFTAACLEDNASFLRIMVRDTGVMQFHAVNDGTEVSKFYTDSDSKVVTALHQWHHVVLVVEGDRSSFWIDGKRAETKVYAAQEGESSGGDSRAFFSDIENLDFVAIGAPFFNTDNNNTESFLGKLDDFYVYNRSLTAAEINYLYDLRKGREQLPRLEASVDAVGTVEVLQSGEGYLETPDVFFSYGTEGNDTAELESEPTMDDLISRANPTDGQLVYVESEGKVFSYHEVRQETDWRHDDKNDGWVEYQLAYGLANLKKDSPHGSVERILWTKDMGKLVPMALPDGRIVNRQFHEYVVKGDGVFASAYGGYGVPHGLFGYTAPPALILDPPDPMDDGSEENATAHALFFADLNHTGEIVNPGLGLNPSGFDPIDNLRISGKGYRPDQYELVRSNNLFYDEYAIIQTAYAEYWGQDKDGNYTFEPAIQFNKPLQWSPLGEHDKPVATQIGLPLGTEDLARVGLFGYEFFDKSLIPDVIFSDWDHQPEIGEPRDVRLEFNQTVSHVTLEHTGFGYSMPVEVDLIGGYPMREELEAYVERGLGDYPFTPAVVEVAAVDGDGRIWDFNVIDAGSGYFQAPWVVVSGGGGVGAIAEATLRDDGTGGIADVQVIDGGRGYFNFDPANRPSASLAHAASPAHGLTDNPSDTNEVDANLTVRLGGYLGEIGRCSACETGHHANKEKHSDKFYHHLDPWIEIWDRNRSEEEIDENGDRALASAKVRDGKIEKVVVVKSGRGYVDPIVRVRGVPPHHNTYTSTKLHADHGVWGSSKSRIPSASVLRIWRCVNPREDKVGNLVECGHVFRGQYPPEQCPGEVDEEFPVGQPGTPQAIGDWLARHIPDKKDHPHYLCDKENYDNEKHLSAEFRSRRCSGRKENFVLLNDFYRKPYEHWEIFDANLTALVEGGRIQEIVVISKGSMYAASEISIEGSGTGVEPIPIYDERGENVRIIYDDEKLRNLEEQFQVVVPSFLKLKNGEDNRVVLDYRLFLPDGAGQGFQERPWSWDWAGSNNPTYGPREKVLAYTVMSELVPENFHEEAIKWSFGHPQLLDNLGDRIMTVEVESPGVFDGNRTIGPVEIAFDSSHLPDVDHNGEADFVSAIATAGSTFRLTSFVLDEDAIYEHGDRNRSLFVEEPIVNILPQFASFDTESPSSFFRLNGLIDYDNDPTRNYFDLYVDNDLPSKFFYGFGSDADGLPAMGGQIIVTEGLPVMSWGEQEPLERKISAYTDQNGYYFIPNLEPGLYNVGVFLEDRKFQDSTFRPDSNLSRVSDVLYVPGFPDLLLETDSRGAGVSRLIWSSEAREQSRPGFAINKQQEINYELKILEGIGGGFRQGEIPELTILANPANSNDVLPNLAVDVLSDGSLKLEIIDDENTTAYDPNDRFTVRFASNVQGVNFREFYQFSESGESGWGGFEDAAGGAWIEIFPNDSNGTGVLEMPLSTGRTGDNWLDFQVFAYDQDGDQIDASSAQWSLVFDFDPPEGNQSMLADLNQTTGSSVSLKLTSTLRRTGIVDFEILSSGRGYEAGTEIVISGEDRGFDGVLEVDADGNVTGVRIINSGAGYSGEEIVTIAEDGGNSAKLRPLLGGSLYLKVNLSTSSGELTAMTQVSASTRNQLTEEEKWLDLYFDSIQSRSDSWWGEDADGDNLNNRDEKTFGTHPLLEDTDGDQLSDDLEITYGTNPHQRDTDGDGLSDYEETVADPFSNPEFPEGTDPRKPDTDKDGMSDGFEVAYASDLSELDPISRNTQGKSLGGYVFNLNEYSGSLYVKVELVDAEEPCEIPDDNESDVSWQLLTGTFPRLYSFENLPVGSAYRVSAFIDTYTPPNAAPDELYQRGEPSACWQGILEGNNFSANLFLQEDPPDIYFEDPSDARVELSDTDGDYYTFSVSSVTAYDLLLGEWKMDEDDPIIQIVSHTFGDDYFEVGEDVNKTSLIAKINKAIPLGSYSISYQATDKSGSESKILIQTVVISDDQGPELQLLGENPYPHPYGSPWEEPGWLVYDNRDDNATVSVSVSGGPDITQTGSYLITYTAVDSSGNPTTEQREVEVIDTIPPSITAEETVVLISKGQSFSIPSYASSDNLDGDLSETVAIVGLEEVDPDRVGDYEILLSSTDSSGNTSELVIVVRVEPPAFSLNGKAIDGYLIGAEVIFDADMDGESDLSSVTYTQDNGEFSLSFSDEEFARIDLNGNGRLDPSEGRILVRGGADSSTGEAFDGILIADANSSVVTPLTSLLSGLMDLGLEKSDAEDLLSANLGIPQEPDLSSFDPFEAAVKGENGSVEALVEGARVASLMKQTESFLASLGDGGLTTGQASQTLISKLAAKIVDNADSGLNPLDHQLEEIIEAVIHEEADNLDSSEVAAFIEIAQTSDSLHSSLKQSNALPVQIVSEITKQQLAIKQDVIDVFEEISFGSATLESLASAVSMDALLDSTESFLEVNVFAPDADDFELVLDHLGYENAEKVATIAGVDLDGDSIAYEILSGNSDSDGDGVDLFSIDANGDLLIRDAGEIANLSSQKLTLSISLSDSRGKSRIVHGVVKVDNALVMESEPTEQDAWMNSTWFGSFHKTGGPWLFHPLLGWQYLYASSSEGFWFWDKGESYWWWTNEDVFPYAFDHASDSWIYYELEDGSPKVYNFNEERWRNK